MRAPLLPLLILSLHVVGGEFTFKPPDLSKFSSLPSSLISESLPKDADWHPMRIKVHYQNLDGVDEKTKQKIMSATRTAVDYWQTALSVRRASKPLIYTWLQPDPVDVPLSAGSRATVAAFRDACPARNSPDAKCASIFHIPDNYMQPCVACEMRADNTTDAFMCSINGRLGVSPEKYAAALPAGVTDADYVLFVTASNCSDGTPSSVAKSTACNMGGIERVAFGGMIVCLDGTGLENDQLPNVMKHEILHALGFSPNIFEALLKDRVSMETQTHSKWLTKHGYVKHTVTVLKSRRVTEEVRKHFNCSTLQGAELESEGGNGSPLSHWEKRLFRGEVGAAGGGSFKLTRLTLALLEDSGWYRANYSMAEVNPYGRGLGCEFVNESCGEWIKKKEEKKQRPAPYCNHQGYGCEFRRQALGYCTKSAAFPERNDTVPPNFQYFPDGREKYTTQFMDNCPYYAELMTCSGVISKRIPGSQDISDVAYNRYGQEYGSNSRCIDIGDEWTKDSAEYRLPDTDGQVSITGGCYQTKCENGAVLVAFGGKWHACSAAGQTIPVEKSNDGSILRGSLICPSYVEICGEQQGLPSKTASTHEPAPTGGPSTDLLLSFSLLHAILLLAYYVYENTLYLLALSTVQPVYPTIATMDYVWMGLSGLVVMVIGVVLAVWCYRKGKNKEEPAPTVTPVCVTSGEPVSNVSTRSVVEESQA